MPTYSSRQVAQKLGMPAVTLSKYIVQKKIPVPNSVTTGGITVYLWTDEDIEVVRQLLPKIKNGRKTRYQKKRSEISSKSAKGKPKKQSAQPRAAVPHKSRKKSKSKP